MKILRRNFLKVMITSMSIISFIKIDNFFSYKRKGKLIKNKKFIWHLNEDD